jgi:hypothetical protein
MWVTFFEAMPLVSLLFTMKRDIENMRLASKASETKIMRPPIDEWRLHRAHRLSPISEQRRLLLEAGATSETRQKPTCTQLRAQNLPFPVPEFGESVNYRITCAAGLWRSWHFARQRVRSLPSYVGWESATLHCVCGKDRCAARRDRSASDATDLDNEI